jgi:large subunit ribosomal protein L35
LSGERFEISVSTVLRVNAVHEQNTMAKKIKLKTHRGAAKRFKRTKSGKFLRGKAFKQHILSSKSRKRKRGLRGTTTVADVDARKLARMLPYK